MHNEDSESLSNHSSLGSMSVPQSVPLGAFACAAPVIWTVTYFTIFTYANTTHFTLFPGKLSGILPIGEKSLFIFVCCFRHFLVSFLYLLSHFSAGYGCLCGCRRTVCVDVLLCLYVLGSRMIFCSTPKQSQQWWLKIFGIWSKSFLYPLPLL